MFNWLVQSVSLLKAAEGERYYVQPWCLWARPRLWSKGGGRLCWVQAPAIEVGWQMRCRLCCFCPIGLEKYWNNGVACINKFLCIYVQNVCLSSDSTIPFPQLFYFGWFFLAFFQSQEHENDYLPNINTQKAVLLPEI